MRSETCLAISYHALRPKANPKQHAIVVVLGRVMVYGITNGVALRTIEGLFAQLALAGVHLGQKYHGQSAIARFGGIARELCGEITCARFWDAPLNLQHPSTWRVIRDGITICNVSTVMVMVILVVFTDHYGSIVCELVSVPVQRGGAGQNIRCPICISMHLATPRDERGPLSKRGAHIPIWSDIASQL